MERTVKRIKRTRIVIRRVETATTAEQHDIEVCPLCHTVLKGQVAAQIQPIEDRYLLTDGNTPGDANGNK
ncbi:MAG: hypothetical protein QM785_15835 [Pyrinomonadaceae bacterium]